MPKQILHAVEVLDRIAPLVGQHDLVDRLVELVLDVVPCAWRGATPSRSELVTALFHLQSNVRQGRAILARTGAGAVQQALATIDEWQAGAAPAAELHAELLELERKNEHDRTRGPLEALIADGQRTYKLSPAMANSYARAHR